MKTERTRAYMPQAKSVEWETPQELFNQLDNEFHFTLDPCATPENAKCAKFYTIEENGLVQSWKGERVFMNPPYGRPLSDWVRKASQESSRAEVIVALLPVRTDTAWFHEYINHRKIRFIRRRLKFGGCADSATFPSMIVIWERAQAQRVDRSSKRALAKIRKPDSDLETSLKKPLR